MGHFDRPLSWFEPPEGFCEKECPECLDKHVILDKIAVHLIDLLRDLYGNDPVNTEELHFSLEEMAGLLDVDFNFKKLKIEIKKDI